MSQPFDSSTLTSANSTPTVSAPSQLESHTDNTQDECLSFLLCNTNRIRARAQLLLKINQLAINYGGIKAVKGIDLEINQGELITLIGANGAGKTTTLKAVTGLLQPASGHIDYQGKNISGLASHTLVKQGLIMVPEGRGVFTRMSVTENLQMGAYIRSNKTSLKPYIEAVFELFPRLKERATQLAGTLSGGEQQMLALSRALMSQPELLLLDEPSMGLSPIMVKKIFSVIEAVAKKGVTIFLVEQNAKLALQLAHRGYVMESGLITLSGTGHELLEDPKVRNAYLGE